MSTAQQPRVRSGNPNAISAWTAFLFGVHCISISSSGLITFSWAASVWPGASIVGIISIALIFCVAHAATYATIGATVPREGADFVFTTQVLSPRLAFCASWTFVVFSGMVVGGIAAWVPNTALPALLRPMSIIFNDPRYADLADLSASSLGVILFGGSIIIISAVTTVQASRTLKGFFTIGFVLGVVAWLVILWSLASADGPQSFRNAWDLFMGSSSPYGHFDQRIPLAMAAGMSISNDWVTMTSAGLIMGFWIFYGYYIPTFFAEEVRSPKRTLYVSSMMSLVFMYLLFLIAAWLLERIVPSEWLAAEGFLENNKDAVKAVANGQSVVSMPWITFYAAILKPNSWLIYIVAFAWVFTLINLVQTYLFYTARIISSWAYERILPSWVLGDGDVSATFRRPIIFVALLASFGLLDSAFGSVLGTQMKFAFFAVVTGLAPIVALVILPLKNPQLFGSVPAGLKKSFLGVPRSSILAIITLAYFVWMIVASFLFPAAGVDNPLATLSLVIAMAATGLIVFEVVRRRRIKSVGIDIALIARQPMELRSGLFD
jgi:amino acid transporter